MIGDKSKKITLLKTFLMVGIVVLLLVTLFPFYWVLRTSLTPNRLIYTNAASLLPLEITWTNFGRVLGLIDPVKAIELGGSGQSVNLLVNVTNSVLVSGGVMIFQVLFSAMAAYAFARLDFPFRNKIFTMYLSGLMIPVIVVTIPNFIFIKELGLLNTLLGIMGPTLFMTPFAVFFLRQFFLGINRELEEASFLDGAGISTTFIRIILPLSQTALVTLGVITFITTWNDYMWPLIVSKKDIMRTLTVALGIFRSQTPQGNPDWGGLMAGAILAIVPPMIILLGFGKKIINSIGFSGIK
ncbi:MAG: carbohydrate ABC transporter permease [Spirochaetaceae bacterium]|jgi:multiple sugar transport system permease protein|nr:carbohydrate ABC transporter permease [Spirochaetaceae bacterium]